MALLTDIYDIPFPGDEVKTVTSARDAVFVTFKSGKKISFHTTEKEVDLEKVKMQQQLLRENENKKSTIEVRGGSVNIRR